MEQPKEPGFYWAKVRTWSKEPPRWQPVEVDSRLDVYVIGDERWTHASHLDGWVAEWGPRITPPGQFESFPGLSAEELLERLKACPRCSHAPG